MDTEDRDIRRLGDHGVYGFPGVQGKRERDRDIQGTDMRASGDVHADSPSGSGPISEPDTGGDGSSGKS